MKVTVLEIRQPIDDPTVNVRSHTDTWMIASSREKAMEALRADPQAGGDDEVWCFAVFEIEVDDPDYKPQDMKFFAFDGRECAGGPMEAWDLLREARAGAPKP